MKNISVILIAVIPISILLISATLHSGGSPGAKTGSPLDGNNCSQCHSCTPMQIDNLISTDIPLDGYVPGATYTISLSVSNPDAAKLGFELTAENATQKVGTFSITNSTDTKLINNDHAITHNGAANSNSYIWTFDWTAPPAGTNDVTFYAAVNAVNGDGNNTGDQVILTSLSVNEHIAITLNEIEVIPMQVILNPINHMFTIVSLETIDRISIYNVSGQCIQVIPNINRTQSQFDITSFKKGIYFITVEGKNLKKTEKIILN